MKTYSYGSRNALILMTTGLLFLITYPASQAMSAEAARLIVRQQPHEGAARLIVHRDPGLGNYVIAHLRVDGVLVATIGYGRTYEGFLPPGRHVLSMLPTPNPKWPIPSAMILDVQSGQTYSFTALGNSGYLILQAPGGPKRPRGR
jgi:hypothetical protein